MKWCIPLLSVLAAAPAAAAPARAPEWDATARASVSHASGNARTTQVRGRVEVERKAEDDELMLETGLAFARTTLSVANDVNGDGVLDANEDRPHTETSRDEWWVKGAVHHFVSERGFGLVRARVGADRVDGLELMGGTQLGAGYYFARAEDQEWAVELAYDMSYERYLAPGVPSIYVHSARVASRYELKLDDGTSAAAHVAVLVNLNEEAAPDEEGDPIAAYDDTRLELEFELLEAFSDSVGFQVGIAFRYDHAPPPRPPLDIPFADGYTPLSSTTEVMVEAGLHLDFL